MNKYNCLSLFHYSVFTSAFTYQSKVVISAKITQKVAYFASLVK